MKFMTFHQLGISSSQLTSCPSFFRGVGIPPTTLPTGGYQVRFLCKHLPAIHVIGVAQPSSKDIWGPKRFPSDEQVNQVKLQRRWSCFGEEFSRSRCESSRKPPENLAASTRQLKDEIAGKIGHLEIGATDLEKAGKLRWEIQGKLVYILFIIPDFGSYILDCPHELLYLWNSC